MNRSFHRFFLMGLLLCQYPFFLSAQTKQISFTTTEGTWMALDVSPDGQNIVFELLGDIYTLPIKGGTPTLIASGNAFQSQARYSPDGSEIVFISDESGSDNVWIMKKNGDEPRQLSNHNQELFISPEWSRDGQNIFVTLVSQGFSRVGSLHRFEVESGEEELLVENNSGASSMLVSAPAPGPYTGAVHPNGRDIYYSAVTPRAYGARQGATSEIWYYNQQTATSQKAVLEKGNAMKPQFSKDGSWMAYGAMQAGKTGLRLRNLQSGQEKWLIFPFIHNELEARATRDVLPNYAFMPDGKAIVAAYGGKIHLVDLHSGKDSIIPFSAEVNLTVPAPLKFQHRITDEPLQIRFVQQPALSSEGTLAFSALGKIYIKKEGNAPRMISNKADWAFYPTWAPDGSFFVFCTWNEEGGHMWKYDMGTQQSIRLTAQTAFYATPAIRRDGKKLVALRTPSGIKRSNNYIPLPNEAEFIEIDLNNQQLEVLGPTDGFLHPQYAEDGEGILATSAFRGVMYQKLGGQQKIVAKSAIPAKEMKLSSGGAELLFLTQAGTLHRVKLSRDTSWMDRRVPQEFNPLTEGDLLTVERPEDYAWSASGAIPLWTTGRVIHQMLDGKDNTTDINIELIKAAPEGQLLLRGATLISMKDDEIIPQSDILIRNNRIVRTGAMGSFPAPQGVEIIDLSGQYIMPGIVDVHAHLAMPPGVLSPISPSMYANLAYGTTTVRDPQTSPSVFIYADLVAAGLVDGPRIFSTGPGLFLWDRLDSYEKMKSRLEIYKHRYQTNYIKSYLIGNRQQRHWMVKACRELELMPTAEGGADAKQDMTHALDGFSGNEHSLPNEKIYEDVVQLFAQSEINYTPTLLVTFGGPLPIYQFLAKEKPFENEKLRYFFPTDQLYNGSATRLLYFREEDYHFKEVSRGVNKIFKAGGHIAVGGHGEMQGLQNHWEMWLLAEGGMDHHDVLRAATINGAKTLGLDKDIGSVESGKLADLIVMENNPLENIRNTTSIKYVMKNGVLYEGRTLNIVHPVQKSIPKGWWQLEEH